MIIIDYLQCFKPIKSEGYINSQNQLDEIVHGLRDLATDLGVIIIALSQIPLTAKKDKIVTMDSSKGSGDAGDASTSALTINGDKESIYRNIRIEKMTDGETCIDGIMMQFNPETFRLERI
jgi:replicative DNA helicase